MTAIALFFTALLYLATIANGLSDGESTELNTVVTTATENAARGNITDRYGQVLVTNRTEYNVTLDVGNMGESKEQLETLSTLLDICKAQNGRRSPHLHRHPLYLHHRHPLPLPDR